MSKTKKFLREFWRKLIETNRGYDSPVIRKIKQDGGEINNHPAYKNNRKRG